MRKGILLLITFFAFAKFGASQRNATDTHIIGDVTCNEKHLPFVSVVIEGTTLGTTTDETGHFQMLNIPVGEHKVTVSGVGYKPCSKTITTELGITSEIKFVVEEDVLRVEEIVVTGDRNAKNRVESSVIVNTLTPKLFNVANTVTLSEGLNFSPGLRMENNCQNCGFTQIRMNGMEGPYSQILINGRAIFSGLAGVYGLELIPTNMIERVEVVRGGGSALYGSNAIAGTINMILKDPINNSYEVGLNSGLSGIGVDGAGSPTIDNSINANTSIVSSDSKTGLALYGFYRDRDAFDANGDEFSELAAMNNTTFGTRVFHRLGTRSKLTGDFFNVKENRRGGDMDLTSIEHEADIAESIKHNITTGALTYEQYFRAKDLWSVYVSGQNVDRAAYYGAEQSLADYGQTDGMTYVVGSQYNAKLYNSSLTFGAEGRFESMLDQKLGFLDLENAVINADTITSIPHTNNTVVADQTSNTIGVFAQYEIDLNKLNISLGGRFDHYNVSDASNGTEKIGNVFSPRVTVKYDIQEFLQARASYSQGYRAPQIFDEDLHIETSGSKKVLHENDPNLTQETSHSFMASIDFNKQIGQTYIGFLAEGFYTILQDAFANEFGEPDAEGTIVYTRVNAEGGAIVQGINMEFNVIPSRKASIKAGYTLQKSKYEEAQEFGETAFFRTPNNYGFFTCDWTPTIKFGLSATGNYTAKMLVPYGEDYLIESKSFFDFGTKARYNIKLNGATLQIFGGIKNLFNSYQSDFDSGIGREPGYIYGPALPRTVYLGLKLGNLIR